MLSISYPWDSEYFLIYIKLMINILHFLESSWPESEWKRNKWQSQVSLRYFVWHVLDRQQRIFVQQRTDSTERYKLYQLVAHAWPFSAAERYEVLRFLDPTVGVDEPLRAIMFRVVPQFWAHVKTVIVQEHRCTFFDSNA